MSIDYDNTIKEVQSLMDFHQKKVDDCRTVMVLLRQLQESEELKNVPKSKKQPAAPKRTSERKSGYKTNLFKGVKKCKKGYGDGRDKYTAQYYNPDTKKLEHLGTFDDPYLAAATYQDRAGNSKGAQMLRYESEKRKKTATPGHANEDENINDYGWQCSSCGKKFDIRMKPVICEACGKKEFEKQIQ